MLLFGFFSFIYDAALKSSDEFDWFGYSTQVNSTKGHKGGTHAWSGTDPLYIPTNNRRLVKLHKSGCRGGNAYPYSVEFRRMSTLDTFLNAQSSKVGKMEKTQPAIFRRKSPNQRRYEDVRSREYLLPKEPKEVDAMLAIRVGATPGYENPARESCDG